MDEADWLAARFEEQRAHLRAVACRMLGWLAEADDAVQNSWLRLSRAGTAEIENLGGWLTTVVGRECLKMLRAAGAAVPFDEIALVLERSPAAARQPRPPAGPGLSAAPECRSWPPAAGVDAFLAALREGGFGALVAVLDPDVVLRDDSAALPGAAAQMRGAQAVGARTDSSSGRLAHLQARQDLRDRHDLRIRGLRHVDLTAPGTST